MRKLKHTKAKEKSPVSGKISAIFSEATDDLLPGESVTITIPRSAMEEIISVSEKKTTKRRAVKKEHKILSRETDATTQIKKLHKKEISAEVKLADANGAVKTEGYDFQWDLCEAIDKGDDKKLKKIISKGGVDLNSSDYTGFTPLIAAIERCGDLKICRILIEAGANVNDEDDYSNTPLIAAVKNNRAEICELLIKSGADVNILLPGSTSTALMLAAKGGNLNICRMLISAGADTLCVILLYVFFQVNVVCFIFTIFLRVPIFDPSPAPFSGPHGGVTGMYRKIC
ncbi:MAG: ankyrin repeat domain-containing protein [Deltaproteobacteria bacterium]|nr:ankyrin repeat domain-containing protein [Deltaproteobacteria bacterium]